MLITTNEDGIVRAATSVALIVGSRVAVLEVVVLVRVRRADI
jgi:hypothetical protein